MPARRISYVIPAPQEPPPQLALPHPGAARNGQTTPLLISAPDQREPQRSVLRASHPQHRLAVSALALDTSTQLVDRPTPEGILYTSGRDGLVAAWELNVAMRRRPTRVREKKRHWEALTGWDDSEDSDDSDDEDSGDGLDGIVRPPRQKKARPPVDEGGWAYEHRWEAASDELKPAQFRQSVQLHTDWINDIVLCNMNQTVVSASSDGTLRTYNPHTTDAPNILGTHTDYARCLAYAPGPRFVASGSFDRTVKLWDISRAFAPSSPSAPELTTLSLGDADPKSSIYAVATDPAGTIVAAGGPERVVRVWDPRIGLNGGEPRCISALRGHTDNIRALLVSEDGRYVLTGSSDASIKLWSLPMRRCIHTFSVHADSVWALHSTHPQLHTFFSGDRAGWICRFDVTQPVPYTRLAGGGGRQSIAGTLNKENEMELSDAFCVVLGRAGGEREGTNGHETNRGITALTAMDDTWVWAASGDSSVQRWRGVGATSGIVNNWGSRAKSGGSSTPQRVGSPPPRMGSPGPKNSPGTKPSPSHASPPPSAMIHTNSGAGRKRVSIDISRHDSSQVPPPVESEATFVHIPARLPRFAPGQVETAPVPYTSLVRLASPNPYQLRAARDPETATLYSHSGVSVHRNVHREDLAMGSGFFGLPVGGAGMFTAPPLNHTNSLPLLSSSSPGAPPLNHTNTNLPLVTSPIGPGPNPSTLPIASDVSDSNVIPLSIEPADGIAGSYGLVRSVVLNDRIHALSVDTRGEVAIWDVVRGICRGVFTFDQPTSGGGGQKISPREALDLVRDRIEGEAMTPAWASVDTRVGDLTVHLIEPKCFDAEVYADEIEWLDVKGLENEGGEEHRLNLGKWVLGNLFAEFTRAELALSTELGAPTPRANASALPLPSAIPTLPSVSEGQATAPEDGINSIPGSPRTPMSLGGLPPPSPLMRTPRGRPMHIPLPTRARSASEASMGGFGLGLGLMTPSGSGLGSATLAPMMSPAILPENELLNTPAPNLNVLSPIREFQTPGATGPDAPSTVSTIGPGIGQGDYFSSFKAGKEKDIDAVTPGNPMAAMSGNPVTPGGGGLMGRLKNLGKTGKRGAATPGGTALGGATGADATTGGGEAGVEEDKDPEHTKHVNLLSSLLSNPLTPPHPHEVPPISFPPNTAVTISEATADASGWMAVFAGSTGTLGVDVEALEMAIPGWLLEFLLAGRLNVPQNGAAAQKMGFMLVAWKGGKEVLPELVGTQSRLTASRFLRVSKVVSYVHDKLHAVQQQFQTPAPAEGERKSHESVGEGTSDKVEREYEILCNEQVLNTGATLAAVRQYVWRNAGELVMHYRVKET